MRTDSVLFLFAHQDDEFGVLHQIEQEVKSGSSIFCAYTTSGVSTGADPKRRNAESRHVLEALGIDPMQILFVGETLNIPVEQSLAHVTILRSWLSTWTQEQQQYLSAIYVPAWEGGHPDHDVINAVAVQVMQYGRSRTNIWQYPLYNCNGLNWGFFNVLTPLVMNGEVHRQKIPWSARLRHLKLCLNYRSQVTSWLGLYPVVLWHYLFKGWQSLQPASLTRLQERPHSGRLYYEFRQFSEWKVVSSCLRQDF